jgi:hypothetical protein
MKIKFIFLFGDKLLDEFGEFSNERESYDCNKKFESDCKHGQSRNNITLEIKDITYNPRHRLEQDESDDYGEYIE